MRNGHLEGRVFKVHIKSRRERNLAQFRSYEMEYIVDLQGFKKPINEFVLKEFAMIPVDDTTVQALAFLVKPPLPWQDLPATYRSINLWLTRNFHGILWDSGDVPYEEASTLIRNILHKARTIYVKGSEKREWLLAIMGESARIVDLENLECPSLHTLRKKTNHAYAYHSASPKFHCAGENAKLLREWLLQPH